MTGEDSAARFLELEDRASKLLGELERLREETAHYSQASATLESAEHGIRELAASLESAATQLQGLVSGLREIGMPVLLDKIAALEAQADAARKEAEEAGQRLDALLDYHSKGPLGRLFGKPRRP